LRLLLVNPNTNTATTGSMVAIAREAAPTGIWVDGATAPFGALLITNEAELATAADAVASLVTPERVQSYEGVIIAAFGDPGLVRLKRVLPVPVIGLAEAGMAEAVAHGPFAVVTTTPDLSAAIRRTAGAYGHERSLLDVTLTPGDPQALMADPPRLQTALESACRSAMNAGAKAIVLGGGPLAVAARALQSLISVPIVEPVPAAVRLAFARAQARPLTR
jgi:allantoin racemase